MKHDRDHVFDWSVCQRVRVFVSVVKGISIEEIIARGSISEGDVLRLRSACYASGGIDAKEAELLMMLDERCPGQARTWAAFLVEAVTDFLVEHAEPEGYVNAANAAWLIGCVMRDGAIRSRTALELVVHVIDRARWAPESLVRLALEQVRDAVVSGQGPLRTGDAATPGRITEADVELVRRILYAFGGDGNVAVTRAEAEVLFDIDAAVSVGPPSPAWSDLFVKALANVVMATSSYAVPTREEALRREAWIADSSGVSPLDILRSVVALPSLLAGYRAQSKEEAALDRLERQRIELIVNERVTEGEAQWLAERIGRDGRLSPNEMALIAYLERESPDIHPALKDMVVRLAPAA